MLFPRIFTGRQKSQKQTGAFTTRVEDLLKRGRPKIGFGLARIDEEILRSLEKSKRYAEIELVGPPEIHCRRTMRNFTVIADEEPEQKLAERLATDQVQGIIRGTLDDDRTTQAYEMRTHERYTSGPALLEDPSGRQFVMSPLDYDRGWTREERLTEARELIHFVNDWGVQPMVAVYAAVREIRAQQADSDQISHMLNKTYEDAEWIVSELSGDHDIQARNLTIELDRGVREGFNIHLLVNGLVGNQILRTFFFCGGRILGATRLGLSRAWEDNSRTEKDYLLHVRWLAATINKKRTSA